jgi:glycosyltransferase involved in cell wall biosynthesis
MAGELDVTVLVATRNEAANLNECLASLTPARRVVVVDSHSTDATPEIAAAHGAERVSFRWTGRYPRKRQWAMDHLGITTAWILLLDADESVPPQLWEEIRSVVEREAPIPRAFLATKQFHFLGRRMRFGGFSHDAVVLFRTGQARFERLLDDVGEDLDMEVHERLIVDGPLGRFRHSLVHRDRKTLEAYRARHAAYATWEAALRDRFLRTGRYGEDAIAPKLFGNAQERRRFLKRIALRLPMESWIWFFHHAIIRGAFLEGRRGLLAARIRKEYIDEVRAKQRALARQFRP